MSTPSQEQQTVLESADRVRIVRSSPGSGKTWLVAELIRRELEAWSERGRGIAALSFTRVGGEEIRSAVGYDLAHPHFVGTLDSFVFRYIVRPFLRSCFPRLASPRLVPDEWGTRFWERCGPSLATVVGQGINLFSCSFIGEDAGQPTVLHSPSPSRPSRVLNAAERLQVMQGKNGIWTRSGIHSHSDIAYWASQILEHPDLGRAARAEVVRRFPLLIVDELQDTGHYLGKTIRLLLDDPSSRGVLVGDPDQSIYEFTGASPDLFESFAAIREATVFQLASTRRCPRSVVTVASHLKSSNGVLLPRDGDHGAAALVRYTDLSADVRRIAGVVSGHPMASKAKFVARHNKTIDTILARSGKEVPRLYCRPLHGMSRAVCNFRQGRQVSALAAVTAALELVVFEHENVDDAILLASDIDPTSWRALAVRCLLRCEALSMEGTLFDWQVAIAGVLDEELAGFSLGTRPAHQAGRLKPQRREGYSDPVEESIPRRGTARYSEVSDLPVQTVHSVKGETHELTLLVCPPARRDRCPSVIWWSEAPKDLEERRIAYVAITRARSALVVLVCSDTHERLVRDRAEFAGAFQNLTVDEYVASVSQGQAAG